MATISAPRLFGWTAAASAAAFAALAAVVLGAAAAGHDIGRHQVSLSDGCHVRLAPWRDDVRVVLFNDPTSGPYRGSIIDVGGGPTVPTASGFGDVAGLYYRHFRWPQTGVTLWTLSVSLVYPLGLLAVAPVAWLARRRLRRRADRRPGFAVAGRAAT